MKPDQVAKVALSKYLQAWKKLQYSKMHKATTHTYRKNYPKYHVLQIRFPKAIQKYKVLEHVRVNDVVQDATVKIDIGGESMVIYLRMVREEAPFFASRNGTWGVNPISIRQLE